MLHAITVDDDIRIPMSDGVRLAARLWRPEGSEHAPVPAILEYLPYRRRDGTAERDAQTHPWFAARGYACLRVDIRGSGDSEGVLRGEYLKQEQDDALEILSWLGRQPWCTGAVGMIGISWGGFNGLQIAARRPPELKAVISICSTDDRYADDIHFMGGALLLDKITWGSVMFSLNAAPPDPASAGPGWREMWRARLEGSGFWVEDWLKHQQRDGFYKHGSVCEDWSAITCPVLAVGGWADGYSNTVFRLMRNLKSPCRGLVGPWAHKYPHFAKPGPAIGFLTESLRWWDQWLKGRDTGVMAEPMLRAYVEDPHRPAAYNAAKPGRWVGEPQWPPADQRQLTLALAPGRLGGESAASLSLSSPQSTGGGAGKWCAYGTWEDQPLDQRLEMGGQLVFDTDPLAEPLEFLGAPELTVSVSSDRPNALLCATLSEVFPDGAATRVSFGILNLTHRDGHEVAVPLVPGQSTRVRLRLNALGHSFGVGNRLRLALSTAYWPIVWPSPEPVLLTVSCAGSALSLPVRTPKPDRDAAIAFGPPEVSPLLDQTELTPAANSWTETRDVMAGTVTLARHNDGGMVRVTGTGMEWGVASSHIYTIRDEDPASARLDTHYRRRYRRGDWSVLVETTIAMRATAEDFILDATLTASENDTLVHSARHAIRVPRDGV